MPVIKSTNTDRSPVILRSQSRKSLDVSQSIKASQTNKPKCKISPAISKAQNESSSSELSKLKAMIESQKQEFNGKIISLRTEIDNKHSTYEAIAKSFEKDIQQIKNKQSEISGMLYSLNATRFNFALPIGFNKPANGHYNFDNIDNLTLRINAIETNIMKIDQVTINLSEAVANNFMQNNDSFNSNSMQTNKPCDETCVDKETFKCEMQCINHELNKMNAAIYSDEESIKKMNDQLHVLSSKC